MKFTDLLGPIAKVGAGIASVIFPPAAALIPIINAVLPADQQLPENATGDQITAAYASLPPEVQVQLKQQDVDLQLGLDAGWTERYKAMTVADGQSTRPKIAWAMAQVLCFEVCAFTVWCFLYPEKMDSPILWTVFAALTATPAGLLGKYFGELRKEQSNRLEIKPQPLLGKLISQFTK